MICRRDPYPARDPADLERVTHLQVRVTARVRVRVRVRVKGQA